MPSTTVIENIKKIRKDSGLRQVDFANFLGIKPTIIENLESGRRKPDLEIVEALAEKLNISPNWLIFGIGRKELSTKSAAAGSTYPDLEDEMYAIIKRSLKFRVLEFRQKFVFFGDANANYLYDFWKAALENLEKSASDSTSILQKIQEAIKNSDPKFSILGSGGLAKIAPSKTLSNVLDFFADLSEKELEFCIKYKFEFLEITKNKS